jgi:outer membrane PBP1 activator LpoA protein
MAIALALVACEAITRPAEPLDTVAAQRERVAQQLLEQERYREAASEFLRLADAVEAPAADELRLRAASAYLQSGDVAAADAVLNALRPSELPRPLAQRQKMLLARLALAENRPDEALNLLSQVPPDIPNALATEVHEVRAQAYAQTGNHLEAARERVVLDPLLTHQESRYANHQAIWQALSSLTEPALASAQLPPPDTLGGWIELAALAKRLLADPQSLSVAVERWQLRYPAHPASDRFVPELLRRSRLDVANPQHIALLLPFEGSFAKAGEAVRDGFLAAWFADTGVENRPMVTVLDTSATDISTVYAQAVAAGADFVVGPLRRAAVSALAQAHQLPVRTLALNYAQTADAAPEASAGGEQSTDAHQDSEEPATAAIVAEPIATARPRVAEKTTTEATVADGLYQFALSPEMEARAVAEQAWLAGHVTAAVLTPQGPWGARVAAAFAQAWTQLGGLVVEQQIYPEDAGAMATAVKQLLNVDDSEERGRTLQAHLQRQLEYDARPRTDLDFIFMAAFPNAARQLRPQLRFYRASEIPVYATSHIFSGSPNQAADQDIDGVVFGDMPWVLSPTIPEPDLRQQLQRLWPKSMRDFKRLFAFGVDAYHVILVLPQLRADRFAVFEGGTGQLSIDQGNRLRRQLMWARFVNGMPRGVTDRPTPTQ